MNRYSPYYDPDEQRVTMTIDAEGSWVHVETAEVLRADADKEWGASATERARLLDEIKRLCEQGEADQRALYDALHWAHEWHGKALPPPTRVVAKAAAQLTGLEQEEAGTLPNGNRYRVRSYSSYGKLVIGCDCGPDNICLRCENVDLRERAQKAVAARDEARDNLRFVEEREAKTVEALTATCLERDTLKAEVERLKARYEPHPTGAQLIQQALNHPAWCRIYDGPLCSCGHAERSKP